MKNNRNFLTGMAIGLIIMFTAGINANAESYVIGFSGAITGPTSDAGNPISKGIEDYFKYANENKILSGDTIKYIIRDDQYKTAVTKRNFEEFLDMDMVLYLNYSTGSTLGLKQDFEEEQIPVVPSSFHSGNLDNSNYIFLPISTYSDQAVGLAEYIARNHKGGKAKVAMFVHPSAFGRGPVNDVKKSVEAGLGIEIVEVAEHGKDLDNTALLTRFINKKVQYIICHTVQSPVATLLKDASRLGYTAKSFGEEGKLTFLGAHYTGGNDLIALAGNAANDFLWATSFIVTSDKNENSEKQLSLAKKYNRDEKAANSVGYTNGIMVAQLTTEVIKRAKAKGLDITKENLFKEMNLMNGSNSYKPYTTVGPVTYSSTDHIGVDTIQLYKVTGGVFKSEGKAFTSEYMQKIK